MVTFLFTDIQESTRLWERSPERMNEDLARHDRLLRQVIEAYGGRVFKTIGDQFCAAFPTAAPAVQAARAAQQALQREVPPLRVRIAVHSGEAVERDGDYFGPPLNRVTRLLAAGHGGQVLLSAVTAAQLPPEVLAETHLRSLGVHRLRDIAAREAVFQLLAPGLPAQFPPLNTLDVAFRRGLLRATAVAALVVAIVAGLAVAAAYNARQARAQRAAAQAGRRALRRNLYAADMNLANQALEAEDLTQARALVKAYQPRPGEEDLRGWEWRYLRQQTRDASRRTVRAGIIRPPGDLDPQVVDLCFSADGRRLASASHDGTIRLWEARSLREIAVLHRPSDDSAQSAALAPDGRRLLSIGRDGRAEVWDLASRRILRSWDAEGSVWDATLALAADGRTVVTTGGGEGARLWDATTGARKGHLARTTGRVILSPDGRTLATADPDRPGAVRLLDLSSGTTRASLDGLSAPLAFGPGGRLLAARRSPQILEIWDLDAHRSLLAIPTPAGVGSEQYPSTAISPDGRLLAFASGSTLRLWDLARKRELARLRGHEERIQAVAFSPDGTAVATGSRDGIVKLWDVTASRQDERLEGVFPLASFSPDGRLLAATSRNRVEVWDLQARRRGKPFEGEQGWADRIMFSPVAFAPNGAWLAAGSGGGRVNVWEVASRRILACLSVGQGIASTVDFSPDSRLLAAAIRHNYQSPGYLRIWKLPEGREVKDLRFAGDDWTAFFSPGGRILVTQIGGEPWRLWNVRTWKEEGRIDWPWGEPWESFSRDGRYLAAASWEGDVRVWDMNARREAASLSANYQFAGGVGFSPDGKTLAAGCEDGTVRLWNVATWRPTITLRISGDDHETHSGPMPGRTVRYVGFSPDGRTLAAACFDRTIRFWRAPALEETAGAPKR